MSVAWLPQLAEPQNRDMDSFVDAGGGQPVTICVGVKVNDCLVFCADSAASLATTQNGQSVIHRVYNHGDKVFNLFRGLPVAAMTCGLGAFGKESISTIAKKIRVDLASGDAGIDPKGYKIEQIAEYARKIFLDRWTALDPAVQNTASFEFFVGGYSSASSDSEVWKFQFSTGQTPDAALVVGHDDSGPIWSGQPEACVRLVYGVSSGLLEILKAAGFDDQQAQGLHDFIAQNSFAKLYDPAMPVRDAIDLARFLAQTASGFVKFSPGADTVGGELDIATVTKYEGFRWISRKHYYPPSLNPETNHVG